MFGFQALWTQELFSITEQLKRKTDINRLSAAAE